VKQVFTKHTVRNCAFDYDLGFRQTQDRIESGKELQMLEFRRDTTQIEQVMRHKWTSVLADSGAVRLCGMEGKLSRMSRDDKLVRSARSNFFATHAQTHYDCI
jgi:hypothetical protein